MAFKEVYGVAVTEQEGYGKIINELNSSGITIINQYPVVLNDVLLHVIYYKITE